MKSYYTYLIIGLLAIHCGSCKEQKVNPPNVIIILTDDQGYGDLSCHGNPIVKTPNLDQLHDESIRFTDFHVASICTPTRSQLMTGVHNLRNRASEWAYTKTYMRRDIPTMPEIFGDSGYRTGLFGKWHLGTEFPHRPGDRGFQESVRFGGASIRQTPDYWDNDAFDDTYWHNDELKQYQGYTTDVFFDEAMHFMRECQKEGNPFLTYLTTGMPHDPVFVAGKYRQPYMDVKWEGKPLPPEVRSFYGTIANIDENMGRLEEFLVKQGLKENTIVIFMGDNGGLLGVPIYNAGMRGKKGTLWEGGHRQSCFIRWPAGDLRVAGDVDGLTEIQDMLPTVIELCGVEKNRSAKFDGISLASLLRGKPQELSDRMLVVQSGRGGMGTGTVLWRRWRLTGSLDPAGSVADRYGRDPAGGSMWQLHNLDADPSQKTCVLDKHPQVVEKMENHYENWWRDIQPALEINEYPHIGDTRANSVALTCFDYVEHEMIERRYGEPMEYYGQKINLTLQPFVRNGMPVHGKWRMRAVSAGTYRIALRRWPTEADASISSGLPLPNLTDPFPEDAPASERGAWYGTPKIGIALPIVNSKVRFGDQIQTTNIKSDDKSVEFTFNLPTEGEVELETWFYDAQGKEICSAYYACITKLKNDNK